MKDIESLKPKEIGIGERHRRHHTLRAPFPSFTPDMRLSPHPAFHPVHTGRTMPLPSTACYHRFTGTTGCCHRSSQVISFLLADGSCFPSPSGFTRFADSIPCYSDLASVFDLETIRFPAAGGKTGQMLMQVRRCHGQDPMRGLTRPVSCQKYPFAVLLRPYKLRFLVSRHIRFRLMHERGLPASGLLG